jgi:hypothetical protein
VEKNKLLKGLKMRLSFPKRSSAFFSSRVDGEIFKQVILTNFNRSPV